MVMHTIRSVGNVDSAPVGMPRGTFMQWDRNALEKPRLMRLVLEIPVHKTARIYIDTHQLYNMGLNATVNKEIAFSVKKEMLFIHEVILIILVFVL